MTKDQLGERLGVAYQIVGALFDYLDVFETPKAQEILDYLSEHDVENPLPFAIEELGLISKE